MLAAVGIFIHYHHHHHYYYYNHNYNKTVKSDWLSTALISALIGQLIGQYALSRARLNGFFFFTASKTKFRISCVLIYITNFVKVTINW